MNVSVVLASYNGEGYIDYQLKSIVKQLDSNDELIISDDFSSDRTIEIVEKYLELPNVYLVQNEGKGFLDNFSTAIKYSKNDIVVFSDQDDVWLEGRIKKIKQYFSEDATVVVLNSIYVDKNLKKIPGNNGQIIKWKEGLINNFIKNTYTGAHMAVDRNFLNIIMPFPKSIRYHDLWIGIMAEYFKKNIKYSKKPFTLYRRHDSNVTGTRSNILIVCKMRLLLLYELIIKIIDVKRRKLF